MNDSPPPLERKRSVAFAKLIEQVAWGRPTRQSFFARATGSQAGQGAGADGQPDREPQWRTNAGLRSSRADPGSGPGRAA